MTQPIEARLPRLLALVPWLRTHPGVLLSEAADAFGVTPKQLRADLELLFLCGLPGGSPGDLIDIDLDGDRITLLDPQVLDRPLRLTVDEGNALLVAVRALEDVPGLSDRDVLRRLRTKLESAVGGRDLDEPPALSVALDAPEGEAMEAMRRGVDERRRLHLSYLGAGREELTERDVDPMRIVLKDGHWYLEAWCHRAEAVRLFRVSRVHAVAVLDEPATPPPSAVPRDLAEGLFRPAPEHLLVELELEPRSHWVGDYYPCEYVEPGPGEVLRVGLRTADTAWIRSLVLRLGGAAHVTAPVELAREIRQLARLALAAYDDESPAATRAATR